MKKQRNFKIRQDILVSFVTDPKKIQISKFFVKYEVSYLNTNCTIVLIVLSHIYEFNLLPFFYSKLSFGFCINLYLSYVKRFTMKPYNIYKRKLV